MFLGLCSILELPNSPVFRDQLFLEYTRLRKLRKVIKIVASFRYLHHILLSTEPIRPMRTVSLQSKPLEIIFAILPTVSLFLNSIREVSVHFSNLDFNVLKAMELSKFIHLILCLTLLSRLFASSFARDCKSYACELTEHRSLSQIRWERWVV